MRTLLAIGLMLTLGSAPLAASASPSPTGLWAKEVTAGGEKLTKLQTAFATGCGGGVSTTAMAASALESAQAAQLFPSFESTNEVQPFVQAAAAKFRDKNKLQPSCIPFETFTGRVKNSGFLPLTAEELQLVLVDVRQQIAPTTTVGKKPPAIADGKMEMSTVIDDTSSTDRQLVTTEEMETALSQYAKSADVAKTYATKAEVAAIEAKVSRFGITLAKTEKVAGEAKATAEIATNEASIATSDAAEAKAAAGTAKTIAGEAKAAATTAATAATTAANQFDEMKATLGNYVTKYGAFLIVVFTIVLLVVCLVAGSIMLRLNWAKARKGVQASASGFDYDLPHRNAA